LPVIKDNADVPDSGRPIDLNRRPVVQVDLGCAPVGFACPHPDPQDTETMLAGVRKRAAMAPPKSDMVLLEKFSVFVRTWLQKNLVPLSPSVDTSVDRWLAHTSYPLWRKEELKRKFDNITSFDDPRHYRVKGFMKDECYPEYKHARGINSRTDEFKCMVGPWFKLIEEEVYQLPQFIKHVPVPDRPKYILDRLEYLGATYFETDYTAFEAQFTRSIMAACEFQLYDYMTKNVPGGQEFMRLVRNVIGGVNHCDYRDFSYSVHATRMSGEMCTSLGNGFSNLMFMLFVCELNGNTMVDGVVEGDDGLFRMIGTPPTEEMFSRLGLIIKPVPHNLISEASFCGIVFDPDDRVNITNPLEVIATFGYTRSQYLKSSPSTKLALLRCKSLSLAHQYPGCPILQSLAHYGLRITRSIDVRRFALRGGTSMWEREQLIMALRDEKNIVRREVGWKSRLLVELKFGIPVALQYEWEKYLDGLDCLEQLDFVDIDLFVPECWVDYFESYSVPVDVAALDYDYPVLGLPRVVPRMW